MDKNTIELCNRVYKKHRQAIDLIIKYRSDTRKDISTWLKEYIKSVSHLALDDYTTNDIRFCVKEWDNLISERSNWTSTRRMLLFDFENHWPEHLILMLAAVPVSEDARLKLSKLAGQLPFLGEEVNIDKWIVVYNKQFLTEEDYQSLDLDSMQNQIAAKWEEFLITDLPQIMSAVKGQWTA